MTEGNMADMMAKLAAAEAEAEKLRSELKESAKAPVTTGTIDELAKQKPAKPENRIDGKGGRAPKTAFRPSAKHRPSS